jgi:hypothetical protein
MSHQETDGFPPGVAGRLRTYVYRLIDPRNGEPPRHRREGGLDRHWSAQEAGNRP